MIGGCQDLAETKCTFHMHVLIRDCAVRKLTGGLKLAERLVVGEDPEEFDPLKLSRNQHFSQALAR